MMLLYNIDYRLSLLGKSESDLLTELLKVPCMEHLTRSILRYSLNGQVSNGLAPDVACKANEILTDWEVGSPCAA